MKIWFTSFNAALTLSALSLLSLIGYTLMEMRYFLERWIPGDGAAMVETVAILLIAGGWMWALSAAREGSRGGLVAMLAFSGFTILIFLYDLQFVFFTPMPWPEQLMVIVMFIMGVIAIAVLVFQFKRSKAAV